MSTTEPTFFDSVIPRARTRFDAARARVDRVLLRMQGRTDSPMFDRWAPWVFTLLMGLMLLWLALARAHSLGTGRQLAELIQSTWLIESGYKPISTLSGGNYMAEQAAFLLYPISIITNLFSSYRVTALLTLQSFALAVGVVPLWRIARSPMLGNLRVGASAAVVFAYAFYAAVHNLNIAGFHTEAFALPALLAAVLFGLTGRTWWLYAAVVVVLLARADLGLVVAGLGILLAAEGRRRNGLIIAAVGLAWVLFAVLYLQPLFLDVDPRAYPHVDAFSAFGDAPFNILGGILSDPIAFLKVVGSEQNFIALVGLFAPVLFLPVVALRYLLPALPLYAMYLAADVTPGNLSESAQTVPMTAFVFVATVFAMRRSGRILVERVNVDRRVIVALLLTSTVFFLRNSTTSLYESPWDWDERSRNAQGIANLAAMIPDDPNINVRASARALPLLAERVALYELDTTGEEPDDEAAKENVDYILFDHSAAPRFDDSLDGGFAVFNIQLESADGWNLIAEDIPATADGQKIMRQGVRLYRFGAVAPPSLADDAGLDE